MALLLLPLLLLPQNQRVDVVTFAGSVSVLVGFVALIGVAAAMAVAVMAVAVIAAVGNTAVVAAGSVSV